MSDFEGMSEDYVDGYKDAEAAYKKCMAELERKIHKRFESGHKLKEMPLPKPPKEKDNERT